MPKITLPSIASGYLNVDDMNNAFQLIENAIDNTVSRDGATPNNMDADFDMNGHRILNLAEGVGDNDAVTVGQLNDAVVARASGVVIQRIEETTTDGGSTYTLPNGLTYTPGSNNLAVFLDGTRVFPGMGAGKYTENDATSISFGGAPTPGQNLTFVVNEYLGTVTEATGSVAWVRLTGIPDFASRWPTYAEVTGKPSTFTPAAHVHATTDITSGNSFADGYRGVFVQSTTPTATRTGDLWFW